MLLVAWHLQSSQWIPCLLNAWISQTCLCIAWGFCRPGSLTAIAADSRSTAATRQTPVKTGRSLAHQSSCGGEKWMFQNWYCSFEFDSILLISAKKNTFINVTLEKHNWFTVAVRLVLLFPSLRYNGPDTGHVKTVVPGQVRQVWRSQPWDLNQTDLPKYSIMCHLHDILCQCTYISYLHITLRVRRLINSILLINTSRRPIKGRCATFRCWKCTFVWNWGCPALKQGSGVWGSRRCCHFSNILEGGDCNAPHFEKLFTCCMPTV